MIDTPDGPPIFTIKMLAERWDCSTQHVRNMIASGRLQAFRAGKLIRVRREVVEALEPEVSKSSQPEEVRETTQSPADSYTYAPRGMLREEAARYIGIPVVKFEEMVAAGRMPKPKSLDGYLLWDKIGLDAAFSNLPNAAQAGAQITHRGRSKR